MAILSALLGANQKAASYSIMGKQAYNQGLRQKRQKYSEANAAELQASHILSSMGRNMMTARANQTAAQGAARAAQAGSGFQMDTGSGGGLEKQVTAATDKQIADMAHQASDQAGSLYNRAYTARNAGDSAMRLGERTQQIYSRLSKASKTTGWITGVLNGATSLGTAKMAYDIATEANDAATQFNEAHGLNEGDPGSMMTVDPFQKALIGGLANTNGSLLPFLFRQQYGGFNGGSGGYGDTWPYSNNFPSKNL